MAALAWIHLFHAQPPTQQLSADHLPSVEETILRRQKTARSIPSSRWETGERAHAADWRLKMLKMLFWTAQQDPFCLSTGVTIKLQLLMTDCADRDYYVHCLHG